MNQQNSSSILSKKSSMLYTKVKQVHKKEINIQITYDVKYFSKIVTSKDRFLGLQLKTHK